MGDDIEVPVLGDETLTVARAGSENNTKQGSASFRKCNFMFCPDFLDLRATKNEEAGVTKLKWDQLRCNARKEYLVPLKGATRCSRAQPRKKAGTFIPAFRSLRTVRS